VLLRRGENWRKRRKQIEWKAVSDRGEVCAHVKSLVARRNKKELKLK